jgi:hypothetical protein
MAKLSSFTNSFYICFYTFSKSYCTATVIAVQSSTRWGTHMFFGTCDTFPTWSFWPFNSSHRFFILLHYSPSSAPSLYIFFMHLYAVLLFMWYISYIPNLIPSFFPLLYYFWHYFYFSDNNLSCYASSMFFGPCDTFPTWSFLPFNSSHPIFFLLHASPSCAALLYIFCMCLIAVLLFLWFISYIAYLICFYIFSIYFFWTFTLYSGWHSVLFRNIDVLFSMSYISHMTFMAFLIFPPYLSYR